MRRNLAAVAEGHAVAAASAARAVAAHACAGRMRQAGFSQEKQELRRCWISTVYGFVCG